MSLPKPSGLKAPGSKIGRPSGLPMAAGAPTKSGIPAPSSIPSKAQSALAKSARAAGLPHASADRYASKVAAPYSPGPESDAGSVNTDDYKIGDRVWVSGTKPGMIAFIGETQFAPGDWAGVVLDEPIGKNDGSVMGVRYFQCEAKRGVFSRLTKLTRSQQLSRPESVNDVSSAHASINNNATTNGMSNSITSSPTPTPPPGPHTSTPRPTTPRLGLGGSHAPSGSSSSLNKGPPTQGAANTAMNVAAARAGLKMGDRVLVSGSKPGVLKYVGETEFAKGLWAGVELDEALGKNDGAVAGKRYFECKPMYGLFAPVHKVTRLGNNPMSLSTPSPMSRSLGPGGLRSARERSGSQESVSSISSSASSVSRSRKALKEKEEHIEQLLRERDLERSEVARAAAQVDEAEGQLMTIKSEQERFRGGAEDLVGRLKTQVAQLEKEKEELTSKLEEEQRRVEDLQFQIEEETICKDDLETTKEEDEMRLRELEKNHGREKRRADALEKELEALKVASAAQQSQLREQSSAQTSYQDQVEELTHKLTQAESRVQQFHNSRLQDGAKSSQVSVELAEKSARISELEEVVQSQRRDLKATQDTLQEMREEVAASNSRCKKLQESIDGLTSKLQAVETQHSQATDELRSAKSQSSDLQRQLAASQEKTEELLDDRNKLEQQVAELMRNSGDSSNQLSALILQLADKSRKVEELQSDLLSSSQQMAKLREDTEEQQRVDSRQREEIVHSLEQQLTTAHSQVEDLQGELEKARGKLSKATEEAERERREEVGRKEGEIEMLRGRVLALTEDVETHQTQTQATRDVLDKVTMDMDTLKFEKEKAEKGMKRAEGERDSMNRELIQAQVEVSRQQSQGQEMTQQFSQLTEQLDDLKADNDRLMKVKHEVEKQRDEVKADRDRVAADRDHVQDQWVSLQAEMQKRHIQMDQMQKEMDGLRRQMEEKQEEVMQRSQTEADMLTEELAEWKSNQALLRERETELTQLKATVQQSKVTDTHRQQLEEERSVMMKEMDQLKESHRRELAAAEAERVLLSNRVNISDQEKHHQQQLLEQQNVKLASLEAERKELRAANISLQSEGNSRQAQTQALAEKVNRLEMALHQVSGGPLQASAPITAASGDQRESQHLQDRPTAQQQVDFLNSVIVELQKKNQTMEQRLHTMEAAMFNPAEEAGLLTMSGIHSRAAPRMFCDICDMFDLHDTDDCPKQAMTDSPPPSHHHGDRHALRPYCDVCEYFIDPDAAEEHRHSKQLNTFFQQHIGFFSDDDVDDAAAKPLQQTGPCNVSSSESPLSSPGTEDAPDRFGHVQHGVERRTASDPGSEGFPEPAVPCIVLSDSEEFPAPSGQRPCQDTSACSSEYRAASEEFEESATGMEKDGDANVSQATTKSEDAASASLNATGAEDDVHASPETTNSEDAARTGIEDDASVSQERDVCQQEGTTSHIVGREPLPQAADRTTGEQSHSTTDPAPAVDNLTRDTNPVCGSQPAEEEEDQEFVDTLCTPDSAEDSTQQDESTSQPVASQGQDHDAPSRHDQPKQNAPNVVAHPDQTTSETEGEHTLQDSNQRATVNTGTKSTLPSTPAKAVVEDGDLPEASGGAEKPVDMSTENTKTNLQAMEQKPEVDSPTKGSKQETRKTAKGDKQVQGDNNGNKGKPGNKGDQAGEKGKGEQAGRQETDSKGEKREQQQDKVQKRASTGASLGNPPPEDRPPGPERPESCVVC